MTEPPSRPRSRWRLELEALAAGGVSSIVVVGLVLLLSRATGYDRAPDLRWVVVVLGSLTAAGVSITYLRNRGVQR